MKRIFWSLLLLGLPLWGLGELQAQSRHCASQEVLAQQLESAEWRSAYEAALVRAADLRAAQVGFAAPAHRYPALPGFQLTGDAATDLARFLFLKDSLIQHDPNLYLELSTNPVTLHEAQR